MTTGAGLKARQKKRAYKAQGGLCWLCGTRMLMQRAEPSERKALMATWEHVIPRHAGGSESIANRRLTHSICNLLRGRLVDEEASRDHVLAQLGPWVLLYLRTTERPSGAVVLTMLREYQRLLRKAARQEEQIARPARCCDHGPP